MDKQYKVIYRDFEKLKVPTAYLTEAEKGTEHWHWQEKTSEAIISWGLEPYDDKVSYRDNLAVMALNIFDAGFVEVAPGKIVSASCVMQVVEHESAEAAKPVRETQLQPQDRQGGRHNRYRKQRREQPQQRYEQQPRDPRDGQVPQPKPPPVVDGVPPKPTPPPNELRKDTESVGEGTPQPVADVPRTGACADDYDPIS